MRVSSAAQWAHNRRCRPIASMSTPLSVSSTYASCLRRNSRQFMRRGGLGDRLLMMCPRYPRDQGLFPPDPTAALDERRALRPRRALPFASFHGRATALPSSVHPGLDDLGEGVPCPVQPRLHRAEVAVRDLGDLFV